MHQSIKTMIQSMTLEEKAAMLSGDSFWYTCGVSRLGIPPVMLTDGPHGLRKQAAEADHLGLHKSVPATCFPSAAGLACAWDADLITRTGVALGEECRAEDVAVLLGPGANIKRSPLCGRNFEYFSEDPLLSGTLAAAHIRGVQSTGTGTSLKHFAVNNQEHRRMTVDARAEERTLREMYLASFEYALMQAAPDTVMCAYNRVNGDYCSESHWLLTHILREAWGFEGLVVSDWGAVNDRVEGVKAGLDLEMPGPSEGNRARLVEAVRAGTLPEAGLDEAVARVLKMVMQKRPQAEGPADMEAHHALAREVAASCMVLLKNEQQTLPVQAGHRVLLAGAFALNPRYQGGGSSHVNPWKLDNAVAAMEEVHPGVCRYVQGYAMDSDQPDAALLAEAADAAAEADHVIVFAGLPESWESEGFDRSHLRMPESHCALIRAVAAANPRVTVVLSNGAPVEMPWLDQVPAVLETYLGGQAWGSAVAEVLTGRTNPSGKLAETFPADIRQTPAYLNFPGEGDRVVYHEGVFVGYRWYDATGHMPLFPFGHGLSYTSFRIHDLNTAQHTLAQGQELDLQVTVSNTGKVAGSEVVQIYVSDTASSVRRPLRELKAFRKVYLQPGESRVINLTLPPRAFAFWHEGMGDWYAEPGVFTLWAGSSSASLCASVEVTLEGEVPLPEIGHNTTCGDLMGHPVTEAAIRKLILPLVEENGIFSGLMKENPSMVDGMIRDLPLRGLILFSGNRITDEDIGTLIHTYTK